VAFFHLPVVLRWSLEFDAWRESPVGEALRKRSHQTDQASRDADGGDAYIDVDHRVFSAASF
jgi:hypothetical protein